MSQGNWEIIEASVSSMNTTNKIREIVDKLDLKNTNKDKPLIALSIGDPAVYENFQVHKFVTDALQKSISEGKSNGYGNSAGLIPARNAIAKRYSTKYFDLTSDDVIITSACSGALEIVFSALTNPKDNILVPKPGFSLYDVLCGNKSVEPRYYNLKSDNDWEIDFEHLESLIDKNTKAIILNNPSNPCGSVYSEEHLQSLVKIAEKHHLPIVADEIYGYMTYFGKEFHPLASITDKVPIISVSGLAKRYLVPGWRVGWIVVYDKTNALKQVRIGISKMTTVILGANTLVQAAIPDILENEPKEYIVNLNKLIESNAQLVVDELSKVKGLSIIKPHGALYAMVKIDVSMFIDEIQDDVSFSKQLLKEESVMVLPGQCFNIHNFFRIVLCATEEKLRESFKRIEEFCQRNMK
eukprot:gene708-8960_t